MVFFLQDIFKKCLRRPYSTANARGNALFLILIAVALFAALSYAVTQSGRGGGNADREGAALLAARFAQYGATVATNIMRMEMANGCSEDRLNFANSTMVHPTYWGGSDNTNAPADGSCDVFGVLGTPYWPAHLEMPVDDPAEDWLSISHRIGVQNVGSPASDIVMFLALSNSARSQAICDSVNRSAGNSGDLTSGTTRTLDWEYPRGAGLTYSATTIDTLTIGDDPVNSGHAGKMVGCLTGDSSHDGAAKILYYVLKAR